MTAWHHGSVLSPFHKSSGTVRYFVDVAEDGLLNTLVFDNLTEDTTVAAADDEDLLRVRVGVERKVGDHLLVAVKFVSPAPPTLFVTEARAEHTQIRRARCIG